MSLLKQARLAGRSLAAEVAAVLAAALASVLSFAAVVVLFASSSGELGVVVAKVRAAPAASAAAASVAVARKPEPG